MDTLLEYKCPCCNGAITFDSGLQKMKCPYCDTEFEVETLRQLDEVLKNDPADEMDWQNRPADTLQAEEEGLVSYVCESCSGEIVTDATTAATSCPYCGNPVVMAQQVSGILRPDCVIPFRLDKDAAVMALKKHLRGKLLLPKRFCDENHIKEIKGVYVPFWLFDSSAEGSARYRATRTRSWSTSRYIYTETSHYSVQRAGSMRFRAVPVDGSSKMEDQLMESLEPFDVSQAVDFQTAYLAGYFADKYDVSADESIRRANERIKSSTEQTLRNTVTGYSSVTPEHCSVRLYDTGTRYALYPVWLLNTRYRGENYHFAMNGQTGKLVGDLPVDWGAFWKWWGLIAAGVSALSCLIYWLVR